ncbi:MAG TPA: helix-turn-helix domain-containing protein [Streptomyces sp.]
MTNWIAELRPSQAPGTRTAEPASRPETIHEAERVLGTQAVRWAVQTSAAISDGLADAARRDTDLVLNRLERQACEASLLTVLRAWHGGHHDRPLHAPPEAVEQVRLAVRQGASISRVLRVPWLCHAALQEELLTLVGGKTAPEHLVEEVGRLTRELQICADQLLRELAACYEAEHAAWQDGLAAARRQVMDEIVATGRAPARAEQILGVRLTGRHLAGVLWSTEPVPGDDTLSSRVSYAHRVARTAGADSTLVIGRPDGSALLLWSFSTRPDPGTTDAVRSVPRPPLHALALGPVGLGVPGLRDSVLGAQQTESVGRRQETARSWAYDDVALLALLSADFEAARRFVHAILPGLTATDARSDAIRETLRTYLRHGRSRTSAGRELNVAATTVAYRVRQAEELLGRPATERPDETVAALRLAHAFPELLDRAD